MYVFRGFTFKLILQNVDRRRENPQVDKRDILARFLEVHEKDPSKLAYREIVGLLTTNLFVYSLLGPWSQLC